MTVFKENYPPEAIEEFESLLNAALAKTEPGSIYRKRVKWLIDKVYEPFFARARAHHEWSRKYARGDVTRASGPVVVDGVLNEKAWNEVKPLRILHDDGTPPWQRGKLYVLYDADNIYFGVKIRLENQEMIAKKFRRRDKKSCEKDSIAIQLRCGKGPQEYLQTVVTRGGRVSSAFVNAAKPAPKNIKAASKVIDDNIWMVEAAIPWKDFIGGDKLPKSFKAQILHRYGGSYYFDCWSPVLIRENYLVQRFGRLTLNE